MNSGIFTGLIPPLGPLGAGPQAIPQANPTIATNMLNALAFGMDPNGNGDSAPAFMQAVQASLPTDPALGVIGTYYTPSQGLYVPAGTYQFNSKADFTKLKLSGSPIANWQLWCDPGAIFLAGPGLGAQAMIDMTPPTGVQINNSYIQFGTLGGSASLGGGTALAGQIGLTMRHLSDSWLKIIQLHSFGTAVNIAQVAATFPFGNNWMDIGLIATNGTGFTIDSSAGANGFQGNFVKFGDVLFNTGTGVIVDASGVGLSSTYNRFVIGAIEHNNIGIIDNSGQNIWEIGNSNSNAVNGIQFPNSLTAGRIPYVRGYLSDTTPFSLGTGNLNMDIANFQSAIGVSAPAPAVPASTVAARNTFDTPVDVFIKCSATTAITVIAVNGVTTGFAQVANAAAVSIGPIRLNVGATITMTYSVAPTWTWLRTR